MQASVYAVFKTPEMFSDLLLRSDGTTLTGLWFMETEPGVPLVPIDSLRIFTQTAEWLNLYFSGRIPDFTPDCSIIGSTPFRLEVLEILKNIPYGKTVSYGQIADIIAAGKGIPKMSARAVGNAVGWNPVSIIIPCHRVIGADGRLTGFGGGISNKTALLRLEGHSIRGEYVF